eukprot:4626157-Pleurochrysis_carterae.AAC.1
MGPEKENRSTERRQRAAVEGIWRFDAVEGAVGLHQERSDTRGNRGARQDRRRTCERSCGNGECAF